MDSKLELNGKMDEASLLRKLRIFLQFRSSTSTGDDDGAAAGHCDDTYLDKLWDLLAEANSNLDSDTGKCELSGWVLDDTLLTLVYDRILREVTPSDDATATTSHPSVSQTSFCIRLWGLIAGVQSPAPSHKFLEVTRALKRLSSSSSLWGEALVREAVFHAATIPLTPPHPQALSDLFQELWILGIERLKLGNRESYLVQKAVGSFLLRYLEVQADAKERTKLLRSLLHVILTDRDSITVEEVSGILLPWSDDLKFVSGRVAADVKEVARTSKVVSESFWDFVSLLLMAESPEFPFWIESEVGVLRIARNFLKPGARIGPALRIVSMDYIISKLADQRKATVNRALRYLTGLSTSFTESESSYVVERLLSHTHGKSDFQSNLLSSCFQAILAHWNNTELKCLPPAFAIMEFMVENGLVVKYPLLTESLLSAESLSSQPVTHLKDVVIQVRDGMHGKRWEERDSALQILHWILDNTNFQSSTDISVVVENLTILAFECQSKSDSSHFVRAMATTCVCTFVKKESKILPEIRKEFGELVLEILEGDPDSLPRRSGVAGLCQVLRIRDSACVSQEILEKILSRGAQDVDLEVKLGTLSLLSILHRKVELQELMIETLKVLLVDAESQMAAFELITELKNSLPSDSFFRRSLEEMEGKAIIGFVKDNLKLKNLDFKAEKLLDDMIVSYVGNNPEFMLDCY